MPKSDKPNKPGPKTPRQLALYRAELSCKVGRDAMEIGSRLPDGVTPTEWAVYNLLRAVEHIATALGEDK